MSDYETACEIDFPLFAFARSSDPATSQESSNETRKKAAGLRDAFVQRLRKIGRPATANEVAQRIESIRKRAGEIKEIEVVGTKKCSVTGKNASTYWFKGNNK